VTAGTQYALVLSAPGTFCPEASEHPYDWGSIGGNPYGGGALFNPPPGGKLTDVDAAFKTYVASGAPPRASPPTPSNAISLGKAVLNKTKGTATVPVFVPGPGVVTLTGNGVVKQRREKASAGIVNILVKPAGKAKHKLNSTGKAKVKITVTYTPTGGGPDSKSKSLVLKKRLR
jgi:hypothetical protein